MNSSAKAAVATDGKVYSSSYDPRREDSIIQPSGLIVISRYDDDKNFAPLNTVIPSKSDPEVNYYHVFAPEEVPYPRRCNIIGADLTPWAGRPINAPNRKRWKLSRFPGNFLLTEQRKESKHNYRTGPYLFGT